MYPSTLLSIHSTITFFILKQTLINILKFVLFVGVGSTILYLVYQTQNANYVAECGQRGIAEEDCSLLKKVITDFKGANYWWIVVVLLAFMFSNISRAIRWNMFVRSLGYQPKFSNSFFTIMLGYFANLGFPRVGEIIRAGTYARYEKIPVEKVMGTVVLDRILDVISILLVTGLAIVLEYDTIINYFGENANFMEKLNTFLGSSIFKTLVIAGVLALVLLVVFRKKIAQLPFFKKIKTIIIGFAQGVQSVWKARPLWALVFHSINIWLMYFLMVYFCFFSFAPTANLPPIAALMAFVFGAWGIVIPSPGGMGTYHALTVAALALYHIGGDDAFSFANISFFSIQIGCNIFFGILALLLLPTLNRNYQAKPSTLEISENAITHKE